MYSILNEQIFTIEINKERKRLSLSEIFAALSRKENLEFCYLQQHQHHAWHSFLVLTAITALFRSNTTDLPTTAKEWEDIIMIATKKDGGNHFSWHLVTDNGEQGFMQSLETFDFNNDKFKLNVDTVYSNKEHILKSNRIKKYSCEDLVFNIVNYQTMKSYVGGYYNASRMNGAKSSRVAAYFTPSLSWSEHFCSDIVKIKNDKMTSPYNYFNNNGTSFLWVAQWKDNEQLHDLYQYYNDMSVKIKVVKSDDIFKIYYKPTTSGRVSNVFLDKSKVNGVTFDPWAPIEFVEKENSHKAITITESNLPINYKLINALMFNKNKYMFWGACRKPDSNGSDNFFVFKVLVNGESKTIGYYEYIVPFYSSKNVNIFASKTLSQRVGEISEIWLGYIASIEKILYSAVNILVGDKNIGNVIKNDFNNNIDSFYFSDLFSIDLNMSNEDICRSFFIKCTNIASDVLQKSFLRVHGFDKYEKISKSENYFNTKMSILKKELSI